MNKAITPLSLTFEHDGVGTTLHPVLLSDKRHMVLTDAGYPGFLPLLEEAIQAVGLDPSDLTHLILTSSELDHVGAVSELLEKYPKVEVWFSEYERRFLEKEKKPRRLMEMTAITGDSLSNLKEPFKSLAQMIESVPPISPSHIIKDRDFEHMAGGFECIIRSNQTLLYCELDHSLIVGDTFNLKEDGRLGMDHTLNQSISSGAAIALIQYLSQNFKIDHLHCFHGGTYQGNDVKKALSDLEGELTGTYYVLADVEEVSDLDEFSSEIGEIVVTPKAPKS